MPRSRRLRKVVVITGASTGVGRATALAFARLGADVALLARDVQTLEATASAARALGVAALSIALDASAADAVETAARQIEETLGPIDVWINHAMAVMFPPVARMTPAEFARVAEATYLSYVWGTMAALKRMSMRNRGVIVQVGSALAYHTIARRSASYGATHAIRGFTDALRRELLHERSRVRVTMVQMPPVNASQFDWTAARTSVTPCPVVPFYQPEAAAHAIVRAATHARHELQAGGVPIRAVAEHLSGTHRMRRLSDAEAKTTSASLWLDTHRSAAFGAAIALALLALLARKHPQRYS
ncbi:SDR family oxidoreductase [Trinickia fusca]|uniref:SDR family NAD(P)-dependent oxidoreductase n=1 Tax=Trinickia fusca TaxID=2419777 RepID=A0A494XBT4_9BURK|nr:SDR family oxidoreductase [Trinickia fusca]RKP45966.1 SDR family NAD(P)-dependent oxidoreductase [Trinickia fusca]